MVRGISEMNKRDLTGKRFGKLVAIDRAADYVSPKGYHKIMWNCVCDCGNSSVAMGSHLLNGHTQSCGCERYKGLTKRAVSDLSGQRFGMLTVMHRMPNRMVGQNSRVVWRCKCDCGNETDVLSLLLTGGLTKSCGCLNVSHAERVMTTYLSRKNISYQEQFSINGLCGVNGGLLRFDFAIMNSDDDIVCLIELDGIQHSKPIAYFGGVSKYDSLRKNDAIKEDWCMRQNISLIRIDVSKCTTDESFVEVYDEYLANIL